MNTSPIPIRNARRPRAAAVADTPADIAAPDTPEIREAAPAAERSLPEVPFELYYAWLGPFGQAQQMWLSTWMGTMQEFGRQWQQAATAWTQWASGGAWTPPEVSWPGLGGQGLWTLPAADGAWSPWTLWSAYAERGGEQLA